MGWPISTWLMAAAGMLLVGGMVRMLRGMWGVRMGMERHCRKCDYIIEGIESHRCPECGEGIVMGRWKIGARRRSGRKAMVGAVALVLGLAGMLGSRRIWGVPMIQLLPARMLVRNLDDPAAMARAWEELGRRRAAGQLSGEMETAISEWGVGAWKKLKAPLGDALLEYVNRRGEAGKLSSRQRERFLGDLRADVSKPTSRSDGLRLLTSLWRQMTLSEKRQFCVGLIEQRVVAFPESNPMAGDLNVLLTKQVGMLTPAELEELEIQRGWATWRELESAIAVRAIWTEVADGKGVKVAIEMRWPVRSSLSAYVRVDGKVYPLSGIPSMTTTGVYSLQNRDVPATSKVDLVISGDEGIMWNGYVRHREMLYRDLSPGYFPNDAWSPAPVLNSEPWDLLPRQMWDCYEHHRSPWSELEWKSYNCG